MMITKSAAVRELVINGDYKKALSIVKGFRLGITKEESKKLVRAYECMVHTRFYEQIGIDITTAISEGIEILKILYGKDEENS